MFCLHQIWQALQGKINFVDFLFLDILCLVIQKPGTDSYMLLFAVGAMPKCIAGHHEPMLLALVRTAPTLHCASKNVFTSVFMLSA